MGRVGTLGSTGKFVQLLLTYGATVFAAATGVLYAGFHSANDLYYAKYGLQSSAIGKGPAETLFGQLSPLNMIVLFIIGALSAVALLYLSHWSATIVGFQDEVGALGARISALEATTLQTASEREESRRALATARTRLRVAESNLEAARKGTPAQRRSTLIAVSALLLTALWLGSVLTKAATLKPGQHRPNWFDPFVASVPAVGLVSKEAGVDPVSGRQTVAVDGNLLLVGENNDSLFVYNLQTKLSAQLPRGEFVVFLPSYL